MIKYTASPHNDSSLETGCCNLAPESQVYERSGSLAGGEVVKYQTPREARPISIAVVHECTLGLDFRYNEVVICAESIVIYTISRLQLLPCRIDCA